MVYVLGLRLFGGGRARGSLSSGLLVRLRGGLGLPGDLGFLGGGGARRSLRGGRGRGQAAAGTGEGGTDGAATLGSEGAAAEALAALVDAVVANGHGAGDGLARGRGRARRRREDGRGHTGALRLGVAAAVPHAALVDGVRAQGRTLRSRGGVVGYVGVGSGSREGSGEAEADGGEEDELKHYG